MKNILIVDDNAEAVQRLSKALTAYGKVFTVFTGKDGKNAIEIIENEDIQLVITELNMPGMNGIALIKHLLKSHSQIPIVVTTAYGTPEIESKLSSISSIEYFKKPLDTDLIIKAIFEKFQISYGQVDGVGLSSFLQILEMEGKTCTLNVISNLENKTGTMYFVEGKLIAAETDGYTNEAAAYEIISWEDVKITIVYSVSKQEQEITQSLMNILMEAAKIKDEKESKKPLIESNQSADTESIQETILETIESFDEISLEKDEIKEAHPSQPDESPEQITAEELMESGPLSAPLCRMKDALIKVIGPIAEIVFNDSINIWMDAVQPSQESMPSLLDILDEEIDDPENIAKYHSMIE